MLKSTHRRNLRNSGQSPHPMTTARLPSWRGTNPFGAALFTFETLLAGADQGTVLVLSRLAIFGKAATIVVPPCRWFTRAVETNVKWIKES